MGIHPDIAELDLLNEPSDDAARPHPYHSAPRACSPVHAGTTAHMIVAANCDPRQFPDTGRFDISCRSNRHFSFGLGIQTCDGNALARRECTVAEWKLYGRFSGLQFVARPEVSSRLRYREIKCLYVADQ